jgi:signal transduction histidine kinase
MVCSISVPLTLSGFGQKPSAFSICSGDRESTRYISDSIETGAEIIVKDYGIGIEPAEMDKIFEPFRRSRFVGSTIPGIGIGLWVTRKLAEKHSGSISVESREGGGTTFTVRIPFFKGTEKIMTSLS